MENSSFRSNADFAVQLPSGFAGEILIFVTIVIKNKFQDNMYQGWPRINFLSVKEKENVRLEGIMEGTGVNFAWVVEFAGVKRWISKTFDQKHDC